MKTSNRLEWAKIGNLTFFFEFSIYAGLTSEEIMDYWYPLNKTRIGIMFDYLPELNQSMTSKWFVENIANTDKVLIWSVEELEIKFSLKLLLEKVISILVFPCGNWEFFEDAFNEKVVLSDQNDQVTRSVSFVGRSRNDSTFGFSRNMTQHRVGAGTYHSLTHGIIDKGTGVPTYIEHSWDFRTADGFGYQIELRYLS
jgi:hypothetical protein